MNATIDSGLRQQLEQYEQQHVLQFWDQLDAEQQSSLAESLSNIDFAQLGELFAAASSESSWAELAAAAKVPPAKTLEDFANAASFAKAREKGLETLRGGKVAMVIVAGGQGSRLGFDHPKGLFPIGPISERTLFQIFFENVKARGAESDTTIPLYIMTSPPTHVETVEFLKQNNWFGIDEKDVRVFCQGTMPAVDENGKLILESKGSIFRSPDGHGGTLKALEVNGCLADMEQRGIEHLFYAQIDNPLVQVCHPALIGYHVLSGSEMTSQVVRKSEPLQKVGNVVEVDGVVQIIEYSDLPEEYARQTNDDGSLKLWAGSIAVHIFTADFLKRSVANADSLPFHRAHKKVPFVNTEGTLVSPDAPNAFKFEKFIFDLLPSAKNAIVCEVDPAEGFCAVKNAPPAPSETPQHVKDAIANLHRSWLESAGATVADEVKVEISPLFATDREALAAKIEPGTTIDSDKYFDA
ncbi:UTP--glucose-1-phosphate uridylyltransferase [Mariniblastus fucicola]|uniref:UTP--glucose-1-phosphate uridylyltransferase n=1 Tax=Mariniblastus fucicola TaxID=980251 RepID=UPI000A7F918B|nr:UDPGP type 1 family protein [Mariniblastus fucicola]